MSVRSMTKPARWGTAGLPRLLAGRAFPVAVLIAVAVLAALLPFVLLGAYAVNAWVARERAENVARVARYADSLARAVDGRLTALTEATALVAESPQLRSSDLIGADARMREVASKLGGHLTLVDRSYRQIINTWVAPGTPLPHSSNRTSCAPVFETGKPVVDNLVVGTTSKTVRFSLIVPVFIANEVRYALAYSPPEDAVRDIIEQVPRPEGWLAAIVDGNGRIVARSLRHDDFYGKSASADFLAKLTDAGGVIETVDLDGHPAVTTYRRSALSGWRAVVWVPKPILDAPLRTARRVAIALLGAALLASLGAAWLVGRAIAAPTRRLVAMAEALGHNSGATFAPTPMREANVVGQVLARVSREIARREVDLAQHAADAENRARALADSEQRLRESEAKAREAHDALAATYRAAPVGLCVLDTNLRYVRINERLAEMNGQPAAAHIGRTIREMVPAITEQADGLLRGVLETGDPVLDVEVVGETLAQPGVMRSWTANWYPLRDQAGRIVGINISVEETTARKRAEDALRASEERFKLSMDATNDGLWDWDATTNAGYFSPSYYRILGYEPGGFPATVQSWKDRIHPADFERALQVNMDCVDGRTESFAVEYRMRARNGEWRWILGRGKCISRDAEGKALRLIGTHVDITERKAAEERQQLLMREVDHRAKNLLTIVSGLLRLTKADTVSEYIDIAQKRIGALARVHSLLTANRWDGVPLADLAARELKAYRVDEDHVRLDGSPIVLAPKAAQPIAMALHELATNATKYGALSVSAGRVDITWERTARGLTLRWTESGGPRVTSPSRKGFGSQVIEQITQYQLGGNVTLDWQESGLVCTFTLPAACVAGSGPYHRTAND